MKKRLIIKNQDDHFLKITDELVSCNYNIGEVNVAGEKNCHSHKNILDLLEREVKEKTQPDLEVILENGTREISLQDEQEDVNVHFYKNQVAILLDDMAIVLVGNVKAEDIVFEQPQELHEVPIYPHAVAIYVLTSEDISLSEDTVKDLDVYEQHEAVQVLLIDKKPHFDDIEKAEVYATIKNFAISNDVLCIVGIVISVSR